MGNSDFHLYMFPYIRKYSGVVVLHDYNLHGLLYHYAVHLKKDYVLYREILEQDYDALECAAYIDDLQNNKTHVHIYDMELNRYVVRNASKILVHSMYSARKLLMKNVEYRVRYISFLADAESLSNQKKAKKDLGVAEDALLFASFGHIHTTKRVLPTMKAFAKLCEEHKEAIYMFVGKCSSEIEQEFQRVILKCNLQDRVTVTDYVALERFKKFMDAADICLNLRYPYNGETSGSLMRILAKGKCVIINDIGSFGEIPDQCCIKIPNAADMTTEQEEVEAIYQAMKKAAAFKQTRKIIGQNARKYIQGNCSPEIVAQQYAECIDNKDESHLNEKILNHIQQNIIVAKHYSDDDTMRLSDTLGYCL